MPIAEPVHFFFRSPNGRYRVHFGAKGPMVIVSCQSQVRLTMNVQKLMSERKHFGLKFHVESGGTDYVEVFLFTNRAAVKEVRVRVAGQELDAVPEQVYRTAEASATPVDAASLTLVRPLNELSRTPARGMPPPEEDRSIDMLARVSGQNDPDLVQPAGQASSVAITPARAASATGMAIANDLIETPADDLEPAKVDTVAAVPKAQSAPGAPAPEAVKINKNAVVPQGDLQVPAGLDDLLEAADSDPSRPPGDKDKR